MLEISQSDIEVRSMQQTLDLYDHLISRARDENDDSDLVTLYKYFESIIMAMPGNVYWLDHHCRVVGCNQNVVEMFGLKTVNQLVGADFSMMTRLGGWTKEAGDSFEKDTRKVLETGVGVRDIEEPPIPGADGQMIYFLSSRMPITDRDGKPIGVVGISIDITLRKRVEMKIAEAKRQAEAASAAKSEFITNMQHDFRTPFNGIYGLANLMQEYEVDVEKRENLKAIADSAKQLLTSCSEIIDFAKSEGMQQVQYHRKFDLYAVANQVLKMEHPAAIAKGLALTLEYDSNLPPMVKGDDFRLLRIMVNLISNAIKFTEQGQVVVRFDHHKPIDAHNIVVTMDIQDTGMGMTKEQQSFIFEKFARSSQSSANRHMGLGLGLGIVKNFIADMDAEIEVTSQPGVGTLFRCAFPLQIPLTDDLIDLDQVASLAKSAKDNEKP